MNQNNTTGQDNTAGQENTAGQDSTVGQDNTVDQDNMIDQANTQVDEDTTKMASKKSIFVNSPIVTILVGPEEKAYYVHKELLLKYSKYFRGAFDSGLTETTTNTFIFDDEEEAVIDTATQYIYTNNFFPLGCTNLIDEFGSMKENPKLGPRFQHVLDNCVKTWIFAEKRGIPALQNAAITALHDLYGCPYKPMYQYNIIDWAWNNTVEKSRLRDFLAMAEARTMCPRERVSPCDAPASFFQLALYYAYHEFDGTTATHSEEGRKDWRKKWRAIDGSPFYVTE